MDTNSSELFFFLFIIFLGQNLHSQSFTTTKEWQNYFNTRTYKLDAIEGIWMNSNKLKYYQEGKLTDVDTNRNFGRYAIIRHIDTLSRGLVISYHTIEIDDQHNYYQITFQKGNGPGIYSMVLQYNHGAEKKVIDTAFLIKRSNLRFNYVKPFEQWKGELVHVDSNGKSYRIGLMSDKAMKELKKRRLFFEHSWKKLYP